MNLSEVVYSGTLALIAFLPAAMTQMVSFYYSERQDGHTSSDMKFFRWTILSMGISLWGVVLINVITLDNIAGWSNITQWEITHISVALFGISICLILIVLLYSIYIYGFFSRLDWG